MEKTLLPSVLEEKVRAALDVQVLQYGDVLQTLWSGYGKIVRVHTSSLKSPSIILKHVVFPERTEHPRGWNTKHSHLRKLRSYQVESQWYTEWNQRTNRFCRTPKCYAILKHEDEHLFVLEDLDASGFNLRPSELSFEELKLCLKWLAYFHAEFIQCTPNQLWEVGTYWHLRTRPDELEAICDTELKNAAADIDRQLNACRYQTLVHGDAKVANFCFAPDARAVAAVDFQYVGGGCGIKDVIYLLGSCLDEEECERLEEDVLSFYFSELREAFHLLNKDVDAEAIEEEWRSMYAWAWADFYRFLVGWMPSHYKVNAYSRRWTQVVLHQLSSIGCNG